MWKEGFQKKKNKKNKKIENHSPKFFEIFFTTLQIEKIDPIKKKQSNLKN